MAGAASHLIFAHTVDGRPTPDSVSDIDTPSDFFRIRLVSTLLDTCGMYFDRGILKRNMDAFLAFFQVSIDDSLSSCADSARAAVRPIEADAADGYRFHAQRHLRTTSTENDHACDLRRRRNRRRQARSARARTITG